MSGARGDSEPRRAILVITPWKRRWEMGSGAGLADDDRFIRACVAHGFDVHYVSPRDREPPDVEIDGYFNHPFPNFFDASARWPTPARRLLWPPLFSVLAGWRSSRVACRVRPALVIAQTHVAAFVACRVARRAGVPCAVKLFGVMDLVRTDWPRWRYLTKNLELILAFKLPVSAWIILDDGTRGDEAARRHGVEGDRIHFLPNGIELAWQQYRGDALWLREALDIPHDAPIALYLARLEAWKRPQDFLKAAALTAERIPDTVFVMGGDGPERTACEALARELGIAPRVRFAGAIPHERVPDAMAAASVFVATSERSNRSIAACEALVCGVPVIAYDVGETRAVIRDGESGRLVPDGNVAMLADVIASLFTDHEQRTALAAGARAFAASNFTDWSVRMEMELAILARLSGAGRL